MKKPVVLNMLLVFMSVGFLLSPKLLNAETVFTDLSGHWAEEEVMMWQDDGLVNGYLDHTFRPNNHVTQAEWLALVNRAIHVTEQSSVTFDYIQMSDWYYADVGRALFTGYIDVGDHFNANGAVTRKEAAVMLSRLLTLSEADNYLNAFRDAESIAGNREALNLLVSKGYLTGYPDSTLRPEQPLTRAEAVVLLDRFFGHLNKPDEAMDYTVWKGNYTINQPNVTLSHVTIKGDLYLAKGIGDGDVYLNEVTVEGDTIIKGGGEQSVYFTDSVFQSVYLARDPLVRLVASGTTTMAETIIKEPSVLVNETPELNSFGTVTVTGNTGVSLELVGTFDIVNVMSSVHLLVRDNAHVESLVLGLSARDTQVMVEEHAAIMQTVVQAPNVAMTGRGQLPSVLFEETATNASINVPRAIVSTEVPISIGDLLVEANQEVTINNQGNDILRTPTSNTRREYTVTFMVDGNVVETETISEGTDATPPDVSKAGYTFTGWSEAHTNIQADITLEALFTPRGDTPYIVEHYLQTDSGYVLKDRMTHTGVTGERVTADLLDNTGYVTVTHEDEQLEGDIQSDGSLVLRRYYDKETYTVTYHVVHPETDQLVFVDQQEVPYLESSVAPTAPSFAGYLFDGWDTNLTAVTKDITVTGYYQTLTDTRFTVEHYLQDIEGDGYQRIAIEELASETGSIVEATSREYTGFHVNPSHEQALQTGEVKGDGSLILKVYYDRDLLTITFLDAFGEVLKTEVVRYLGSATPPNNVDRVGYTFIGFDGDYLDVSENITVQALYQQNTYTLRFDTGGLVAIDDETKTYGEAIQVPMAFNVPGYTFLGWEESIDDVMPAHDVTYTAMFEPNSYQVTFIHQLSPFNSVGMIDPITVTYHTPYGVLPEISEPGYQFIGWALDPDGISMVATSDLMTTPSHHTLYGIWEPVNYKITFDPNGGRNLAYSEKNVPYLSAYGDLPTIERVGYTFLGWKKSSSFIHPTTIMAYMYDHTLTATWTPNDYTVTFDLNDGTGQVVSTDTVRYDSLYGTLPNPTRTGYTFLGWETSNKVAILGTTVVSTASDHTLYAQWLPNDDTSYKVEHYKQTKDGNYFLDVQDIEYFTGTTGTTAMAIPQTNSSYIENINHPNRISEGVITGDGNLTLRLYYDLPLIISPVEPLKVGETTIVQVQYSEGVEPFVTWHSVDETIATIDQQGVITAVNTGVVTMSAEYRGTSYLFNVEVYKQAQLLEGNAYWGGYGYVDDLMIDLTYTHDVVSVNNLDFDPTQFTVEGKNQNFTPSIGSDVKLTIPGYDLIEGHSNIEISYEATDQPVVDNNQRPVISPDHLYVTIPKQPIHIVDVATDFYTTIPPYDLKVTLTFSQPVNYYWFNPYEFTIDSYGGEGILNPIIIEPDVDPTKIHLYFGMYQPSTITPIYLRSHILSADFLFNDRVVITLP